MAFPNDVCKIQLLRHPSLSSNYHSSDVPSSGNGRQTTFVGLSAIPLFLSNTHTERALTRGGSHNLCVWRRDWRTAEKSELLLVVIQCG